jgi:hypothetical protein
MRENDLFLENKMLFVKEQAKKIAKLLRDNGIRAGVVRGNGTTSPAGADKYTAYITIEPPSKFRGFVKNELLMSFTMDIKTGKKISEILTKNNVKFTWSQNDYDCFIFPVDFDFTGETFTRYGSYDTETGILSHVYESPHQVRMCFPDFAEKHDNIELVELKITIIKKINKGGN